MQSQLPQRLPNFDVVREALEWVDTPFGWQQSLKGVACDCKGLISGVARQLGRPEGISTWAGAQDYRFVSKERLLAGLEDLFDSVPYAVGGDVLLLNIARKPQHLAIVTEARDGVPIKMVHTYNSGPSRVREIKLGSMVETIHSIWTWRD